MGPRESDGRRLRFWRVEKPYETGREYGKEEAPPAGGAAENMIIPIIREGGAGGAEQSDLYSRLLKDRIVLLGGEISEELSCLITAQLLYLEAADDSLDIRMYIQSPGGSVTAGLAIYDTMRALRCPVSTIAMGQAASMGAFLLAGGTRGKRFALPHAGIMIHQPLGGCSGPADDMLIRTEEILRYRRLLNGELARNSNLSAEEIEKLTVRDCYMEAETALRYGLIDGICGREQKLVLDGERRETECI